MEPGNRKTCHFNNLVSTSTLNAVKSAILRALRWLLERECLSDDHLFEQKRSVCCRCGVLRNAENTDQGKQSTTPAHLAVEYWKLLRAFERTVDRLPREHVAKTSAQLRFSARRLELLLDECGLKLVTFDGQEFEPNLPMTALNSDDFSDGELLTVDTTIEPAVVENMTVLHLGKVVLKKAKDGGHDVSGD